MPSARKRLVLELDDDEHMAIKTSASLAGMTMRQYVLNRVWSKSEDDDTEYDKKDVTDSIAEALEEVIKHRRGEIQLPTLTEALDELDDD